MTSAYPGIDDLVTAAGDFSQPSTRRDRNRAWCVTDQACGLELSCRDRDRCPACAKNPGNRVLSKVQGGAAGPLFHNQQPAAQPLVKRVRVVADSDIRDLREQVLHVTERHGTKDCVFLKVFAQSRRFGTKRNSRDLHHSGERIWMAQKTCNACGSLVSHRPHFDASAAARVAEE